MILDFIQELLLYIYSMFVNIPLDEPLDWIYLALHYLLLLFASVG